MLYSICLKTCNEENDKMSNILDTVVPSDINYSNKSARMPVILCLENLENRYAKPILNEVNHLLKKIAVSPRLRLGTEVAVLQYGDEVDVVRNLSQVSSNVTLTLSQKKQSDLPQLGECLSQAIKQIKLRMHNYKAVGVKNYPVSIFLFSSGKYCDDIKLNDSLETLAKLKLQGTVNFIPFSITDDCSKLKKASSNGELYLLKDGSEYVDKIFDTIGKSMESLSTSSDSAYSSITEAYISWKDLDKARR